MSWESPMIAGVLLCAICACMSADADRPPRSAERASTTEGASAGLTAGDRAADVPHRTDAPPAQRHEGTGDAPWAVAEPLPAEVPSGRAIAALQVDRCMQILGRHGVRVTPATDAEGVEMPLVIEGPVGGVEIVHRGRSPRHSVVDCRLVVALLAWSPTLRAAGVSRIEHFSIYRPGARVRGTGVRSGHSAGLAIDAGVLERDGNSPPLSVVEHWTDQRRDVDTCRPPDEGEPDGQLTLRRLVCAAAAADLFQVIVTPHGDDDHADHVHLELRAGVDWSHVN